MGDLGDGTGSSYPAALDTDTNQEVNSPSASKTKARAEVPNDLAAAVIAVQTELGIDPAGSLTNVVTFLQTEHNVDGTHNIAASSLRAGQTVQIVNVTDSTLDTGTTQLPLDDTKPQITEGDEYMTLAITPTSVTNKLIIEVVWMGAHSVGNAALSVALFQDTTADALAASVSSTPNIVNSVQQVIFRHYMAAGTTSSTTFRIRAGANQIGTTSFNGFNAGQVFDGVASSSITITEVAV